MTLPRSLLLGAVLTVLGCAGAPPAPAPAPAPEYALTHQQVLPLDQQNLAYRGLNITQEVAAREVDRVGARPTVLSRQMMIWAVAMFDAWAAYDAKAVGSRLGGTLRRPLPERTLANKNQAVAYASYRALLGVFPADAEYLRQQMRDLGYDPDDASLDVATPQGIGNVAAAAVLSYRLGDGANQLGDEIGGDGKPYSDYTYYQPVNDPDRIVDPDRWQPITFTRPDGTRFTPGFLTPHWYRVKPFALESSRQFRAEPVPLVREQPELLKQQTDVVLEFNCTLSDEQKAIVEFMRDGPRSTGQSGHWLRFAQDVSRRERHDLDQDVKLYFAIAVAAFDAFLACWETKRHYDTSRPWTLVRHYFKGQRVRGWAGPKGGVREMDCDEWHPYSPYVFVTPPFPGYTSGHATVSGASAKMLELFSGNDRFEFVAKKVAGEITEPGVPTAQMQAIDGRAATDVPATADIDLPLPTFSATADMAAESRLLGGYHIRSDNDDGLASGRKLAEFVFPRYKAYWDGTAKAP